MVFPTQLYGDLFLNKPWNKDPQKTTQGWLMVHVTWVRCDFAMKLQVERPNVPGVGLSEERCRHLGVTGSDGWQNPSPTGVDGWNPKQPPTKSIVAWKLTGRNYQPQLGNSPDFLNHQQYYPNFMGDLLCTSCTTSCLVSCISEASLAKLPALPVHAAVCEKNLLHLEWSIKEETPETPSGLGRM